MRDDPVRQAQAVGPGTSSRDRFARGAEPTSLASGRRPTRRRSGAQELNIYLTQESPRISGHTTSEYGESHVCGTIDDQAIAFTFEATDGGKAVVIRVTAKVEGARRRGTAKIGDRVDGAFTAERSD